ncbi:GNAT family N-acetyltransferase [Brachybacterium kimchii]|uniref:GNAT family N-acetyltransferase n=1 Tax=Brachybacterium kimchii TaxID=2942909 RepID=A0ABY4N5L6_9MICO|nr:GNAT family N-acetyltransferase [Brachybacterium kimchii]UQN29849.1 GNAT family N-acetyltransferase [Brachybacterium kimchii]
MSESGDFPEQTRLPAGMRLRVATLEDALPIAELELRLFPEDAWTFDMVREEIAHPSRRFVVVEQGSGLPTGGSADEPDAPDAAGEIVGYAGVMLLGDSADLHTIGTTLPGRGIGRALLDWSLRATREGGARALVLEVREDNARARSVYETAGFQDIGRRPGYYPGPRGPVDARVMIRELAQD